MTLSKTINLSYAIVIISIFTALYLVSISLDSNTTTLNHNINTATKTADKISKITAAMVYSLDKESLESTIKSLASGDEEIKAMAITDSVSGDIIASYLLEDQTPKFGVDVPKNLRSYFIYGYSEIVHNNMIVGQVEVYLKDEVYSSRDRFKIWYLVAVFGVVIVILWAVFKLVLRISESSDIDVDFSSSNFTRIAVFSVTIFVTIICAVGASLSDSSESYETNKAYSELSQVIVDYKVSVEEKMKAMANTYYYVAGTSEFKDSLQSLLETSSSPLTNDIVAEQQRMVEILKKYSSLHIGETSSFSVMNTKGATLASYGDLVDGSTFNDDIYTHFLSALEGKPSLFPVRGRYDQELNQYVGNLYLLVPIINDNLREIVGVIVTNIVTDEIYFPDSYKKYFQNTGEVIAVDLSGSILSRCKAGNCSGNLNIPMPSKNGDLSQLIRTKDHLGNDVFVVASWQDSFEAVFVAKMDVDEVLAEHYGFRNSIALIIGAMTLFTVGAITLTIRISSRSNKKLITANRKIIERLGNAAEFKDNDTGMHVIRMSHYSKAIAKNYGCTSEWCEDLLTAAPMHDIGKIGIPDKILHKPDKLDKDEWETMKEHPAFGAKIIGDHNSPLLKMAKDISIAHHEKWDGSGYPYGLSGEMIPLSARIIAIADVYDALTSVRPYKRAWTDQEAKDLIISESGCHFDPDVVKAFILSYNDLAEIKDRYTDVQCNPLS